ncbi:MAG: hypothetical protein H6719_09505 [Sandaracinaceae bacterium]|nr:hypothetical protein [Sandaracinaceae bacterium]
MSSARSIGALLLVASALLLACDPQPSDARRLRTDIEPFLDEVARFDAWARRMDLAESAFRSREAMAEAAFAPIRDRPRIVAAWLVREGPGAMELRHPADAPTLPEDGWVRVLLPDHPLDEVTAQRRELRVGAEARQLVLIRRSRPAPDRATLHVTLAF